MPQNKLTDIRLVTNGDMLSASGYSMFQLDVNETTITVKSHAAIMPRQRLR